MNGHYGQNDVVPRVAMMAKAFNLASLDYLGYLFQNQEGNSHTGNMLA